MTSDDAPPSAATVRGPARTLALIGLVAFLAGVAAMAAAIHYWGPGFGPRAAVPPVQQTRVAPQPQPAPVASLRTLSARETMLSGRLAELEARLSAIDGDARVAGGYATRAESMMVVFAVRRALDRGLPLGYLEAQLRNRFGATHPGEVATIVEAAGSSVTLEDLRTALDTIAPQLAAGDPQESWWSGIRRELSQLVVLRQETTPSARAADRLTRARRRLDAGQVEGALAEVVRMPGAASAESWIDAARRYIAVRRALVTLESSAIATPVPAPPTVPASAEPVAAPDTALQPE